MSELVKTSGLCQVTSPAVIHLIFERVILTEPGAYQLSMLAGQQTISTLPL